jgi:hypothetical protein
MSRSRLFLGGLHSCIARFRFASRIHLRACRLQLKTRGLARWAKSRL